MFHGWRFDPDGDQAAAESTRSSTSFGTCRSVNPRTARRLVTASYTSMIAHLLLANAPQRLGRGIPRQRRQASRRDAPGFRHRRNISTLGRKVLTEITPALLIRQSLCWHERRSALVLDQEHQE